MPSKFQLHVGKLTLSEIKRIREENLVLELMADDKKNIEQSRATLLELLKTNKTYYGVNTGFGSLASTKIPTHQVEELQRCLVLSHAAGTGELLDDAIVKLILLLKINSLARGFSGVRLETIDALIALFNQQIYPCIPAKGSVGASGDLAPLAHLACTLLGVGEARYQNKIIKADTALKKIKLSPLRLQAKEGLALLNGTQVSTALALQAIFITENVFKAALLVGAMSTDAALGSDSPFAEKIQQVRGQRGQIIVAKILRDLLRGSKIRASHRDCEKVQDAYSLRCQPQVMGACLDQLQFAASVLETEANAVTDNPLIFADEHTIISGGNFHAQPVVFAADNLALAIAEIGAMSERRIALLIDPKFSGLPSFLVENSGLNSGFMSAQVTAAALASENKSLAHPASVDSIPTSANQEDHVSMATFAARRLSEMVENTSTIVAIELLAACQGIELRKPLKTSPTLQKVFSLVRKHVRFYAEDRYFAPDIAAVKSLINQGDVSYFIPQKLLG